MISVDNPFPKGTEAGQVVADLQKHYNITLGRFDSEQLPSYLLLALSLTVRDRLMERWRDTRLQELRGDPKRVFYLSLEFLLGRTLHNAVMNLELEHEISEALKTYSTSLEELWQNELMVAARTALGNERWRRLMMKPSRGTASTVLGGLLGYLASRGVTGGRELVKAMAAQTAMNLVRHLLQRTPAGS